ncbi:hypothetical protein Btru_061109 [Bulinus truncatus]|nr:hypothetical protein Btru_061109 [Bulinus truncatus]
MVPVFIALFALCPVWGQNWIRHPACDLPFRPIECDLTFPRFYYKQQSNTCEWIGFRLCNTNENNFGHRRSCELACIQPTG